MIPIRVLHVDDEPDIREVVEVSLGLDPGLITRSCGSGHEALAVAMDWPPDIILLDVMMPVMDGPSTLARLRDSARTAGIPVVFMTARAQTRELDRFRSLGAAGVIPKPFDPMTLAASVRSYAPPLNDGLDASRATFVPRFKAVFLQRLSEDGAALTKHRCALTDNTPSSATLTAIRDIAHGLAGAGGIFDCSEISDAAAELEEAILFEQNGAGTAKAIVSPLDRLLDLIETHSTISKRPPISRSGS
jgi:CheY-like chemotaxis protein